MRTGSSQSGRAAVTAAASALLATASSVAAPRLGTGRPVSRSRSASWPTTRASSRRSAESSPTTSSSPSRRSSTSTRRWGGTWELFHEDLGTVGEAQAARTCLEQHGAEIVVSIAHGYRTYRDFMMDWWQRTTRRSGRRSMAAPSRATLAARRPSRSSAPRASTRRWAPPAASTPTSIGAEIGRRSSPPRSRASSSPPTRPQKAAEALGLEVLARIDAPAEQPSLPGGGASRSPTCSPDAVIVQARLDRVRHAHQGRRPRPASRSNWIGETGWVLPEFIDTLGADAIASQEGVGFAAFSPDKDTPAWESFSNLLERDEVDADDVRRTRGPVPLVDLRPARPDGARRRGRRARTTPATGLRPCIAVGDAPGEVCNTYADCLALIRAGTGHRLRGHGPRRRTRRAASTPSTRRTRPTTRTARIGEAVLLDAQQWLEMVDQIKVEATCDPAEPPNQCEW